MDKASGKEERVKEKTITILFVGLAVFAVFLAACTGGIVKTAREEPVNRATPAVASGAAYAGSDACADCHEDTVKAFKKTIHGKVKGFETKVSGVVNGCEACHGPASKHIEDEDPSEIISFKGRKLTPIQKSEICLRCHTSGQTLDWAGSRHSMSNVACTDCHTIHKGESKASLAKSEPELCYGCHKKQRGEANMPSHHPIKEGKMDCTSCHNPHTASNRWMLKTDERINDLCFTCHADKEGPFVFEHAPVVENCTICHNPHGTVANNLLKQNEPFVCLQCHHMHFHSGLSGHTGYGIGKVNGIQQVMTTKCTQCHSQVHGSNLPSNTRPGMGRRLTR